MLEYSFPSFGSRENVQSYRIFSFWKKEYVWTNESSLYMYFVQGLFNMSSHESALNTASMVRSSLATFCNQFGEYLSMLVG